MKHSLILILLVSIFKFNVNAQSEICQFVAEISVISIETGAFLGCTKTGNPATCTIALAAHNCGQEPSCDGTIKYFVEKGCTYTVEVVNDKMKIIGKASKEKIFELQETFKSLSTVEGLTWIEKVLTGGS